MKKEVLFAIAAGGGLGLLIAFGVWKANSIIGPKNSPGANTSVNVSTTTTNTSSGEFKISLTTGEDLSVVAETPFLVSGVTKPNINVIVSGEENDVVEVSNEAGAYSTEIDLVGGSNQIKVSAYNSDGNEVATDLTIVYSSQFVRDPAISVSPISYIGTVTDVTDSIIQIKNAGGDIQQIRGAANTSYVDTRNEESKLIKESDVAIGDYLIAMGYKNGSNVLNSSRVIITDAITTTSRASFYGKVTDTAVGEVSVTNPVTNKSITVSPAANIQIDGVARFSLLKEEDTIIVVGELEKENIEARTIKVIK